MKKKNCNRCADVNDVKDNDGMKTTESLNPHYPREQKNRGSRKKCQFFPFMSPFVMYEHVEMVTHIL